MENPIEKPVVDAVVSKYSKLKKSILSGLLDCWEVFWCIIFVIIMGLPIIGCAMDEYERDTNMHTWVKVYFHLSKYLIFVALYPFAAKVYRWFGRKFTWFYKRYLIEYFGTPTEKHTYGILNSLYRQLHGKKLKSIVSQEQFIELVNLERNKVGFESKKYDSLANVLTYKNLPNYKFLVERELMHLTIASKDDAMTIIIEPYITSIQEKAEKEEYMLKDYTIRAMCIRQCILYILDEAIKNQKSHERA